MRHVRLFVVAKLVWRLILHQFGLSTETGTYLLQVKGHHRRLFQDLNGCILTSTLDASSLLVKGNGRLSVKFDSILLVIEV